ncbi:hypothetical protein [Janthinobacterium sp.]|uniref:hypothetical protein n=1 Tax=Janthinobacterium sp. TaxID=1871054 RepID=UPI00289DD897|nr:hypothetical protein [Janthinobacterium sp.]
MVGKEAATPPSAFSQARVSGPPFLSLSIFQGEKKEASAKGSDFFFKHSKIKHYYSAAPDVLR